MLGMEEEVSRGPQLFKTVEGPLGGVSDALQTHLSTPSPQPEAWSLGLGSDWPKRARGGSFRVPSTPNLPLPSTYIYFLVYTKVGEN